MLPLAQVADHRTIGEKALVAYDYDKAVLALGSAAASANEKEIAELKTLQQAASEGRAAMQAVNELSRQAEIHMQVSCSCTVSWCFKFSARPFLNSSDAVCPDP